MRKPAYNALEIARSVVVAILERSGIDLINCRDLPPLPDHCRFAAERRGHLWKGLIARSRGEITDTRERLFGRKVPGTCGQPENQRNRVPLVTAFVIEIALRLRKLLQPEGLDSWPKTTGGKGLHLMVPIDRDISHDAARLYCKRLAQRLEATDPARYTTSSAPAKRNKRIYIDYLRNGRGTTAIGAYSPRAREGFPVAAPVTWAQV